MGSTPTVSTIAPESGQDGDHEQADKIRYGNARILMSKQNTALRRQQMRLREVDA